MNFRRFLPLLWGGLLAAAAACAQPVSTLYDKAEYRIAMRDSVRLHTSVYTPKAPGRAPIIIFRTPYGTGPYGADAFPAGLEKGDPAELCRSRLYHRPAGRAGALHERGRVHARPSGRASRDADEATDSYDTVEWLVKHIPGNNGRVGFAGSSYPGFYARRGRAVTLR